jgi:hypothetical protein
MCFADAEHVLRLYVDSIAPKPWAFIIIHFVLSFRSASEVSHSRIARWRMGAFYACGT